MRIICVTPWFPSHREEQTGNFILDSIESLVEMGHDVCVLVTQPWRPNQRYKIRTQEFKFAVHTCRYLSIPRSYFSSISNASYRRFVNPVLAKLINNFKPDVLHAQTEMAGMSVVDVGRQFGLPTVTTVHGISTEPKIYRGKARKQLFEFPLANTNRLVLVGEPLRQFCAQFVKTQDHFKVVHNGFRLSQPMQEKIWQMNKIRFISVSNLQEGKGIDLNLQALARLKQAGIGHWTYNIVGDGILRQELEASARSLNIANQVTFSGACEHHQVYTHLKNADVFILPSYREAFGVAYLEAMASGLLTIGVKNQGPSAFIEHEQTGLLVAPKNVDDLAQQIKKVALEPEKFKSIAQAGQAFVKTNFTWQKHAVELTKVYQELL